MRKIKVLYISHEYNKILGSTLSLDNLINSVKKEVDPIILIPKEGIVCEYFKNKGYKCIIQDFETSCFTDKINTIKLFIKYIFKVIKYCKNNSKAIHNLINILERENIELIHSNTSVIDIGYYLSKKLNVKHVWHLREMQSVLNLKPLYGWKNFYKKINAADAIIYITEATRNYYNKIKGNTYVIFDAVRSEKEIFYNENKEKYFIFCGTISKVKGIERAIDIYINFCNRNINKNYRLKLIGPINDNKLKDDIILSLKKHNLQNNVDFVGYSKNIKDFMINATALLMCSPNEAQGRVTIEAMFYGCIVVGYNAGGTKEIIENNKTGFLFNNNDEGVVTLEKIVNNDIEYRDIISNAHNFVKLNFSEENYGDKINLVYKELKNENKKTY